MIALYLLLLDSVLLMCDHESHVENYNIFLSLLLDTKNCDVILCN